MRSVFIYGGCTSRDAVEYYPAHDLELHSYIARQSLISAFRPADRSLFSTEGIPGSFQRRMLAGDIVGTLPKHLSEHGDEFDLMVWDLMIERVGVQKLRSGGMVTRNGTPQAEGAGSDIFQGSYAFGTDAHKRQWSWAFTKLREILEMKGLTDKVVVNATPWAVVDNTGAPARSESTMMPEWFNENVRWYWDEIESSGIKVARVAQEDAIADPHHKWGPAYFHYDPHTYEAQLSAIAALL